MRSTIIFLCIFVFAENSYAQTSKPITSKELIGVWQIDDPVISSAYKKCFCFYKNEKFKLHYSRYDDLARIRDLEGSYNIHDTTLYLQILSRTEFIGGKLVHGSPGFQMEEFVLEGAKPIVIKQTNEKLEPFDITPCKSKNGAKCIQIDNNKYYKITSDPNNYTD